VLFLAYGCGGGGSGTSSTSSVPPSSVPPGSVPNGSATLTWDAPSTNTDVSPITDIAGYKLYYGTQSGSYPHYVDVGNVTTYKLDNLTVGTTYFFAATVYNTSGVESGFSNEVAKSAN
jgi:hypothetical protein